jgi:hypothetical protein
VNADPGYDKDSKMAGEETQLEAENSDLIAPKVDRPSRAQAINFLGIGLLIALC